MPALATEAGIFGVTKSLHLMTMVWVPAAVGDPDFGRFFGLTADAVDLPLTQPAVVSTRPRQFLKRPSTRRANHSVVSLRVIFGLLRSISGMVWRGRRLPAA